MHGKTLYRYLSLFVVSLLFLGTFDRPVQAQSNTVKRPIDMMILIDNSCSMFPANQIRANCDSFGSDPNFLRITGADLFIARLGFGESNEADYQLGVIGVGDEPSLISGLQPVDGVRDEVAGKIAHPLAQPATRIVPAIQKAFDELKKSPKHPQNVPAIVLITDGIPWPKEGQGNTDIEKLIDANPDVPLFIMLLQTKTQPSTDYQNYIKFWEQLQSQSGNIFVYKIKDANQIEETYNQILGQLQNTVPSNGVDLSAGKPYKFFVNQYIQRMIITVIRNNDQTGGTVTVQDPSGMTVNVDDPGVRVFRGKENPIEVFSLASPRLDDSLKGKSWTLTSTDDVTIFIDREGAYRINYISPETQSIDVTNVYQVQGRQSPSKEFIIHFNLLDSKGKPIPEPQTIQGSVINPLGGLVSLPTLASVRPDSSGLYEFKYDLTSAFPNITNQTGRFVFILSAGIADDKTKEFIPVTTSRLIVNVGLIPYIRSIAPIPVACQPNQPFDFRVNIGDFSSAPQDSLKVRVFYGDTSINLVANNNENGAYTADLSPFCEQMIARQSCSYSQLVNLVVQLDANSQDGAPLTPVTKQIQAQIISPNCTVTPYPTATLTPAPSPTPVPGPLLTEKCSGIQGFPSAGSCVSWNFILWGAGILGFVFVSRVWVWPWVRIRTIMEPPAGFLLVCRDGKALSAPISLYDLGKSKRTSRISIGSDWKSQLILDGLRPVEFILERKSIITVIREPDQKEPFAYLDDTVKIIRTSDPKMILKACMDKNKLAC